MLEWILANRQALSDSSPETITSKYVEFSTRYLIPLLLGGIAGNHQRQLENALDLLVLLVFVSRHPQRNLFPGNNELCPPAIAALNCAQNDPPHPAAIAISSPCVWVGVCV